MHLCFAKDQTARLMPEGLHVVQAAEDRWNRATYRKRGFAGIACVDLFPDPHIRGSRNCRTPTWWTWTPCAQSGRCTDGAPRQLSPMHCMSAWAFENSRFDGPSLQPREFHQVVGVESGRKDGP